MTALLQIPAAFAVGLCYYMLAMAMTVYDGFPSLVLQPVVGTIVTGGAVALLLVLGSPIRFVRRPKTWWRRRWWIPPALGTAAFAMMVASWLPSFRVTLFDPDNHRHFESLHPALGIGGWLLTIFSVLHFYPPLPFLRQSKQA